MSSCLDKELQASSTAGSAHINLKHRSVDTQLATHELQPQGVNTLPPLHEALESAQLSLGRKASSAQHSLFSELSHVLPTLYSSSAVVQHTRPCTLRLPSLTPSTSKEGSTLTVLLYSHLYTAHDQNPRTTPISTASLRD